MHTFKCNGIRAAVHTGNGTVFLLDSLAYDMMNSLTPPLTEDFPMGLRYAFAKYDSKDLKEAYAEVRRVFEAADDADAVYDRLTSADVTADLSDKETVFRRFAERMGDAERFALTIHSNGQDISALNEMITAARSCIPCAEVTVRCPLGTDTVQVQADGFILIAGDSSTLDISVCANLPDNAVLSCTFGPGTDLSTVTEKLYKAGCRKLSLVPADNVSAEEALLLYEKLSRTLTRMYRTVKDFMFLPFSFRDILPGQHENKDGNIPMYSNDCLPGYFANCGLMSHLTADITDRNLLAKCAEYAIVLHS